MKGTYIDTRLLEPAPDSAPPSDYHAAVDPTKVPARHGVNGEIAELKERIAAQEREIERLKTERDQIAFATRMEAVAKVREFAEMVNPYDQTLVIAVANMIEKPNK